MIKVEYARKEDVFTLLAVSGHANSDMYGKDLVCAATSTIMFGLCNALTEKEDVDIEILDNKIKILNNSDSEVVNDYLNLAYIQLLTLKESQSSYFEFNERS